MMKFTTLVRLGAGAWSETSNTGSSSCSLRLRLRNTALQARKPLNRLLQGWHYKTRPKNHLKNLPEKNKKKPPAGGF
jgi:tRNA(Phe) wybutosine-synthesizing methylase Tyw3